VTSQQQTRNPGLDLLRLAAVLLVMGRHIYWPADANPVTADFFSIRRGGWIGVDIFFVLSGFLVSGLLFNEYKNTGSLRIGRFLIRRALKIYPAFWCLLLPTILVFVLISNHAGVSPPFRGIFGELLFMQNYIGRLWGHTWSLAIEEHFYIGFALFLAIAKVEWVPRLCVYTFVFCLAMRFLASTQDFRFDAVMIPTHFRIDSLMAGVYLSYGVHFYRLDYFLRRVKTWIFFAMGVTLLLPAFIFTLETTWWIPVFGLTLFYVGSMSLVYGAYRIRSIPKKMRGLQRLGAGSYSIYLWHLSVGNMLAPFLLQMLGIKDYWAYLAAYFIGALALGLWMARLIENPVLRIRNRVFPSGVAAVIATK